MGEMIVFVPQQTVYRVGGEWKFSEDGIHQADILAADSVPRGELGGTEGKFFFGAGYKYQPSPAVVETLTKAGFKDFRRTFVADERIHHAPEPEYTPNAARKEIAELRERVEEIGKVVFALEGRIKEGARS